MEVKDSINNNRPFRILTLDGGGMRGLYSASILRALARFSDERFVKEEPDWGKSFDLICGTSTGSILACCLAAGISLSKFCQLYIDNGKDIFSSPVPRKENIFSMIRWAFCHFSRASADRSKLKHFLEECLRDQTFESVYRDRGIALCIPCVDALNHRSWVFKTPHHTGKHRDNHYLLVDACLASAAAPIIFPLSMLRNPDNPQDVHYFVDGGLWANNPIMVGIVEALSIVKQSRPIHVFSLGTCDRPSGDPHAFKSLDWGLRQWRVGVNVIEASLAAQSYAYLNMARFLAKALNKTGWTIKVVRFEESKKSPKQCSSIGIDCADSTAIETLISLSEGDAQNIHSDIIEERRSEYSVLAELLRDLKEMKDSHPFNASEKDEL